MTSFDLSHAISLCGHFKLPGPGTSREERRAAAGFEESLFVLKPLNIYSL